jgi:hypothetical protein
MARARKRTTSTRPTELPELPEGKPLPDQPSPGGIEGVENDWAGGASNVGEVVSPGFEKPAPYSTKDLPPDAPRTEVIARFRCDDDGQVFPTEEALNVHRRTAHHPRG